MRGNGRVYRPTYTTDGVRHTAKTWWLDYTVRGKRHREPTGTTVQKVALDMLHARVGDRRAGRLVGNPDDVLLAEYETGADGAKKLVGGLRYLHETQYDLDGLRSKERAQQCWNNIEAFFPAPTPVTAGPVRAGQPRGGAVGVARVLPCRDPVLGGDGLARR